jgi:hypothetical protein
MHHRRMAKDELLPHGPLRQLGPTLWVVDGDWPRPPIGRRMAIIRLADGRLVLHSVIGLKEETLDELDRLGPVGYLVVPNGMHRTDAPRFHARYPGAEVLCPPGARTKVGKVVTVSGGLDRLPADPGLRWELLDGCAEREAAFLIDGGGGVDLLVTDALFNLPDRLPGFSGKIVGAIGSTGGPKVTWLARRLLVKDRRALADHLRRLADSVALRRVIMAHGAIIEADGSGVVRMVAGRLSPAAG